MEKLGISIPLFFSVSAEAYPSPYSDHPFFREVFAGGQMDAVYFRNQISLIPVLRTEPDFRTELADLDASLPGRRQRCVFLTSLSILPK